ncbi:MAG: DUF1667 domain-containing protein [Trueperaceae bacterium]|nr:DUF1667 domain-containing protein [Trueperaceae bacterium]
MRETTEYLCIGCPLGCRLEVDEDEDGEIVEVRGFSCKRGKQFALQEHTQPVRSVATTVHVKGGAWPRLPVRTTDPIPKDRVAALCDALHGVTLHAPVQMGQVVLDGPDGTVVASRDMPAAAEAGAQVGA